MTTDVLLFWISFWLYFAGFLCFVIYLGVESKAISMIGSALMYIGFIPHTIALGLRWKLSGHPPFANSFEYMSVMSWASVLAFMVVLTRFKRPIIGAFIAPFAFFLLAIASLFPKDISQQLMPALQSYWLHIHVSITVLGSGVLAMAFGISVLYLLRSRAERRSGGKSGLWERMPSLETLDELNYRSVAVGFLLFTVGALFAGAIWAHYAWGTFWGWDPKEVGSLIIWLFYAVYLHARHQRDWRGRRAAWMSIIGFTMILLSFAGNNFLGGQHAYG